MSSSDKSLQQAPVMKGKPGDYADACYAATFKENKENPHNIRLTHRLPPGNLVNELIEEGAASYACEVISPKTFYRELYINPKKKGAVQELNLDSNEVHLGETILRPIIVSVQEATIKVRQGHGLLDFFLGYSFEMEKGTIMADGGYFDVIATESKLFSLHENIELANGSYSIEISYSPSFHLEINLASDLHKNYFVIDSNTRAIFLTGILASSLELIGKECWEEGAIKTDFLDVHQGIRLLLEDIEGDCEDALYKIKEGKAAEMASTYRSIKMVPTDDD